MPTSDLAGDGPTDKAVTFAELVRAYQRVLKARPSTLQRAAMHAAARAAMRYDRALRDDSLSGCTLAHYERVSRRAYSAMLESFRRSPEPGLTLEQLLRSQREATP
jgi:hypothetical protein